MATDRNMCVVYSEINSVGISPAAVITDKNTSDDPDRMIMYEFALILFFALRIIPAIRQ